MNCTYFRDNTSCYGYEVPNKHLHLQSHITSRNTNLHSLLHFQIRVNKYSTFNRQETNNGSNLLQFHFSLVNQTGQK